MFEDVMGLIWHKSLRQPFDTGDAKKPRVGAYVSGNKYIEQGGYLVLHPSSHSYRYSQPLQKKPFIIYVPFTSDLLPLGLNEQTFCQYPFH